MRYLICFTLVCLAGITQGQFVKSYIPPSPNAASLGLYAQIPVSEYAGIPDINIPLDSAEVDDFNLSLSLSYHAAGFRRSDNASWTGLGWSLNAGGVITRSKRHKDDFAVNGFFRTTSSRACGEDVDQEPDMFFYNFGGRSGKFIMLGPVSTYKVRTFTRDNLKIEFNELQTTWKLTTGEGIIYNFQTKEFTTDSTVQSHGKVDKEVFVSSWYLTSIELVNGTKINFSYQEGNNTRITTTILSGSDDRMTSYSPTIINSSCCSPGYRALKPDSSRTTTTIIVNETILSRIDFPNGAFVFHTSARNDLMVATGTAAAKKLDSIQVFAGVGAVQSPVTNYQFTYDYFTSGSGSPAHLANRLRLLSVQEKTPLAAHKPYTFAYNSNSLPDKSNTFSDYLGAAGLLQSIKYPTGGSTQFEFEPHAVPGPACGARVRKIYSKDPTDSLDVRRFEYTGGKVMGKIMYGLYFTYKVTDPHTCSCGDTTTVWPEINREEKIYTDFSSLSETIQGYNVGYDKVITWFGENGENGKKESFFENTAPTDPNYYAGKFPVPVPLNTSAKNGLLLEEYQYRNNNGTFVPVHYLRYIYNSTDAMNTAARRFAVDKCDWTYTITTEWIRRATQVEYKYEINGANPVSYTTQYYYDDANNCLPTRTLLTTDSKGKPVLTTHSFAKQKSTAEGGVYTTMLNKNMISIILDEEKTRDGIAVSKSIKAYKDWYGNGKVLAPETIAEKTGANNAEVRVRFHEYDERGNVIAHSQEGGRVISYIWGYGNVHPIVEVTNAATQPLRYLTTEGYNVGQFLNLSSYKYQDLESFTTNYGQTYNFSVRVVPLLSSGSFNGTVTLRLMKKGSQLPLFEKSYYSGNTFAESVTLPNGTESYYFSVAVPYPGTNTNNIRLDITSSYSITNANYSFFHTSFEELTSRFVMDGRTGKKCYKGVYMLSLRRPPGKYILSWWQKPGTGGNWVYHEQLYTITAGETLSAGVADGGGDILIDEVRLYPQFAKMTTYTFEPGIGMTSSCNERNQVTTYEYDELNRLRIVRDHAGNIVKTIEYNYKN